MPSLGLYPTLETLAAQGVYVAVIVLIQIGVSKGMRKMQSESRIEVKAVQFAYACHNVGDTRLCSSA